ncbi:LuxR C-terminal-related transcriptional regulator [Micromonospora sp. SH-82]|uniref:LuxR C-terminal-related transcriptional regulator n=1 Tax=Micromonospora sp. SH-82 TaxID=3132938 RepID=UPI003EBEA89E
MPYDGSSTDTTPPLLTSRLSPPPPPEPLLVRPRLLDELDRGAGATVTLVTGPAGWGKSTLLASWARAAHPTGGATAPAWLSVEVGDSGERFWAYLAAAATVPVDLSGPARLDALAAALAAADRQVVLVLDDLHRVVDPSVPAGLEFLVRHAEGRLRLVIGAREALPPALHRLRLTGELTELGPDLLAFTDDEVADLLVAHGVHLPAATVPRLRDRTAGWPAALRFAALALRGHSDPDRWVRRFGGDHPDVAGYLGTELLDGLDPRDRDVLRRCAVTPTVRADLAVTLTDRADADQVLAALARDGGFLHHDQGTPQWFRYHPMLADLLRAELGRVGDDQVTDLHRRAAGWYADRARPADALRHALAAGEWERAVTLVTHQWPDLIPYDGDDVDCPVPVPVPPPPEALHRYPGLALALAVERVRAGDAAGATEALTIAVDPARVVSTSTRQPPVVTALELTLARQADDRPAARALAHRLLASTSPDPADSADPVRSVDAVDPVGASDAADPLRGGRDGPALGARAVAGVALGLLDLADGDLTGALDHFGRAGEAARAGGWGRTELVCAGRIALLQAVRGDLGAAERTARELLDLPVCQGWTGRTDCAYAHLALAVVALHRHLPQEAAAMVALAGPATDTPVPGVLVVLCRVPLLCATGDLVTAHRLLTGVREVVADLPAAGELAELLRVTEADLLAARGDLAAARHLLTDLTRTTAEAQPATAGTAGTAGTQAGTAGTVAGTAVTGAQAASVALARVELLAGDQRAARRALPDWDGPDADRMPLPVRLEAGLLDAVLTRADGDPRRAGRLLERILDLAAPDGYRRAFLQGTPGVRDLLAAHLDTGTAHWVTVTDLLGVLDAPASGAVPAAVPGLAEPLTERELTILRYLQSILSNVEIAGELSVSVNTVKTHVRNIYRKLDATRRREAVRRARELHLL